ncbi:4-galactosyl-N-acetylglucosaminide 3-alpha-L-fucosyltransferase FUT5-like isoform X3 [Haliotis rufescens]|uniref:4-galactosyl-N-acetylglucosaminide 3-alpha-L-fucosyltransferase FUT5-like isoform X3 n=1 Tax=Haliotis rufescens TaxID=6454 RepID=UPI00201F31F1|nr:4-galactosyl-N-acetylglucosaminide 3-alpha-L-fucosyltransferase FUT5-like isoform X3 [Haliotis rufescens]XP_048247371.1 4-galactosyl-N-acetylglucosaminide 3-alpha-L-fucosyltransferase FUT5-like isoform X3 [Haliotis rufescens]
MTQCNGRFLRRRTVLWTLLALTLLTLIAFHVDVPIRVYKSGIAQIPPSVTPSRWERPRQFLDNVDVYKITNEDPLAWTLSVLPPHPSGKIINDINPYVQPVTRIATGQNDDKVVPKSPNKPKLGRKRIVVVNNTGWDWIRMGDHVDVPIRVYKSGIAQNPPSVTPPRWERPRQFLDNVDVYKITNEDPLAWTLSVLPPHPSGKMINNINPNVQPVTRMANGQNGDKVVPKSPKPKLGRKRIVVVNNPGWDWIRMGDVGLTDCPVECTLTADTAQIQMADAIIFYAVGYFRTIPVRAHGQVWIFLSLESPSYSLSQAFEKPEWHGQINWTMTYRSDSDIFYPYGRVNRRGDFLTTDYTSLAEKKTKKVAWVVSHCETDSKREDYVRLLKQHIGVDTFGMCGLPCGNEGSFECLQMLTNDYKFYLSFENTLCLDYVTEKLFRKIMVADVVPVVRGFVNYTKYMPPKSFINADDFSTVAELGKYLNYLDKNMTAYLEYLEWRKYYFVVEKPNPTCEVCMKLLEPEKYRNVYEDVFSWWTKGVCHSPKPIV